MLCQNSVNISSFDKTGKYLVQSIIFLIGKNIRLQITGLLEIKIVERHMISPILQTTFPRLHLCILYYYKYSVINYHLLSIAFLRIVFIAIITAAYELLNFWYFNLRDYGWKTISSNMSTTFTQAKKYTVINYKLHL